ncbi:MAG TPA: succinate dehydrogenase assembly factor 2 [Dongiaceae bacterium]|nr:succinate dehydrogenase assembly factor 2 [Dongiaceae bacterium]
MAIDDQTLRKRLRFRSWHRGTREMDLILGRFADRHLAALDHGQLESYALLLEESDPDIYEWLTGLGHCPAAIDRDLWRLLRASFADHPIGKDPNE